MFKFTNEGLVEFGEVIELTEADRACIAADIAEKTAMPTMLKVNGIWQQRSSLSMLDGGYRIHEEQEEIDAIDRLNSDLDDLMVYRQLASV